MLGRLSIAVLLVATGCGERGPDSRSGCEQSESAVLSVAEGLIAADNRNDLESVLGHYTDDIVFITPEGDLVEGKRAIRPRYQELFRNFVVDIRVEFEEAGVGFEWAFVRGRNVGTLTSKTTDVVEVLDDRFLMILRCEPASRWRVSRLAWVHVQ